MAKEAGGVIHVSNPSTIVDLFTCNFFRCLSDVSGAALNVEEANAIWIFRFTGVECFASVSASFCWLSLSANSDGEVEVNESNGIEGNCPKNTFYFDQQSESAITVIHDLNATSNSATNGASGLLAETGYPFILLFSSFESNYPSNVLTLSAYVAAEPIACLAFNGNRATSGNVISGLVVAFAPCTFRDCIFVKNDLAVLVSPSSSSIVTFLRCIFDESHSLLTVEGDDSLVFASCELREAADVVFDFVCGGPVRRTNPRSAAVTTESPARTTESPARTTEFPSRTTESPARTRQSPAKTRQSPAKTRQSPARTTQPRDVDPEITDIDEITVGTEIGDKSSTENVSAGNLTMAFVTIGGCLFIGLIVAGVFCFLRCRPSKLDRELVSSEDVEEVD
jgi:hypothetical protein